VEAIDKAGYTPGEQIALALDVAASELGEGKDGEDPATYSLAGEGKSGLAAYPLFSIEDGVAEGDRDGWKALTESLGSRVQLVGDDLFVTNPAILAQGIADGLANALQIGRAHV